VGAQPEWHALNLHHGEPSGWRRHDHDSKGPRAEAPRSGVHDMPLILPFQSPADTVRNTTEELHSVTTQYTASNKATQLRSALSHSGEVSSDVTILDAGEGAKGGRKRRKQHL
jgi:hypothetical protein